MCSLIMISFIDTFNKAAGQRLCTILVIAMSAMASADQAIEEVVVIGSKQSRQAIAGSATLLSESKLVSAGLTDLNQILLQVPGVYIREEDGFGLRPNIGIRGATSERSQKITLMEDGILITPAPYAAPAAYYIPSAAKIVGVEVLKGPSAINHGPHTVGGVINLLTRNAERPDAITVDLELGSYSSHKATTAVSRTIGRTALLGEVLAYGSSGFKSVDGGGETGFKRQDYDLKVQHDWQGNWRQRTLLKFGMAEERSDETYLGLSDTDFDAAPLRRYAASRGDRFNSKHSKIHLIHKLEPAADLKVTVKGYGHRFDRSWLKLDGFVDGPSMVQVLEHPNDYVAAYLTMTGALNSDTSGLVIDKTNNARKYRSRGLSIDAVKTWLLPGEGTLSLNVSARRHVDGVRRKHQPFGYQVFDGRLIDDGEEYALKVNNDVEARATSLVLSNQVDWKSWSVDLGVRHESIQSSLVDFLTATAKRSEQSELMPGLGISRFFGERFIAFAGLYEGFSPASGAAQSPQPERSINYEYGVRYFDDQLEVDLVGFFSDYDNLLGRCRASDVGCDVGTEFSGGNVEIGGVELAVNARGFDTKLGLLSADVNYTYTESAFQSQFLSSFSQWGLVSQGDALPYLPTHVGRGSITLSRDRAEYGVSVTFQDQMREKPGYQAPGKGESTERFVTLDITATYQVTDKIRLQALLRNVTNERAVISRRPFGARPNMPRYAGLRLRYGGA